jgi:hypothetical protein
MTEHLPKLGADGRILEGLVTTLNEDQSVNISPMGPIVDPQLKTFVLRPFRTSTTYQNLKRTGQGVFHVTDDVQLIAQAAVGAPDPLPRLASAQKVVGMVLVDACRSYEFTVESLNDDDERTLIVARTVAEQHHRDFFGFNRAKHAVLEAAILATRVQLLPAEEILAELCRMRSPVEKTAGAAEREAFDFLQDFIEHHV